MIILLMGVSGSGKTTIGTLLAERLGWEFADADDFHSAANIALMAGGIPLADENRAPWLEQLAAAIGEWLAEGRNVVLACSALKQKYREQLMISPEVRLVYLRGSYELILSRMMERNAHYMKAEMLRSQFEVLEEPVDAVVVDVAAPPEEVVASIVRQFEASRGV